jgi:hypothetical protein
MLPQARFMAPGARATTVQSTLINLREHLTYLGFGAKRKNTNGLN